MLSPGEPIREKLRRKAPPEMIAFLVAAMRLCATAAMIGSALIVRLLTSPMRELIYECVMFGPSLLLIAWAGVLLESSAEAATFTGIVLKISQALVLSVVADSVARIVYASAPTG